MELIRTVISPPSRVHHGGFGCCSMFYWDSKEPTIKRRENDSEDGLENVESDDEKIANVRKVDRYVVDFDQRALEVMQQKIGLETVLPTSTGSRVHSFANDRPNSTYEHFDLTLNKSLHKKANASSNQSLVVSPQISVRSKPVSEYQDYPVGALKAQVHHLIQLIFETENKRMKSSLQQAPQTENTKKNRSARSHHNQSHMLERTQCQSARRKLNETHDFSELRLVDSSLQEL